MDAPDPELDAVLLHVINHVARTSDRIKKNNEKLSAEKEKKKMNRIGKNNKNGDDDEEDGLPRDQGFARPKVLILLPMRSTAMRVVSRLLKLAIKETRVDSIQNKERFMEEFGTGEEESQKDGNTIPADDLEGLNARERAAIARKPIEHRSLFSGNADDHFRLGMKLTRGAVRLYTDFYQSDVLIASPLALATKLSEAEKDEGAGAADFLSSIEIVVLERADVLQMQNWTHVTTVLDSLNKMPSQQRDVDIMRVREWMLSGQAKHYRQTIVLSSFASAEMNSVIVRKCSNHSGRIRVQQVNHPGVLRHIVPQVRQIYERLSIPVGAGPAGDADARFENFKSVIWPRIRETARGGGQLIYIPSYFDFVRVRNFLRAESASFLGLCEYTERADMARARSYFADGRRRVLVYTERAQFYNRHRIRGVKDILFYQLPEHPQFYSELVNFLEEENTPGVGLATATVMYSKYDALRLERVVGSERAKTMMKKKNGTFLFC
jgi:U3 small nucleolar RNA-associated protein 25